MSIVCCIAHQKLYTISDVTEAFCDHTHWMAFQFFTKTFFKYLFCQRHLCDEQPQYTHPIWITTKTIVNSFICSRFVWIEWFEVKIFIYWAAMEISVPEHFGVVCLQNRIGQSKQCFNLISYLYLGINQSTEYSLRQLNVMKISTKLLEVAAHISVRLLLI